MSLTVDQLAKQLQGEGWDGIENASAMAEAMKAEISRLEMAEASQVARAFASPEGQWLLGWLVKKTLLKPSTDHELAAASIESYALMKARREGQNQVIYTIIAALDVARGEPG